MTSALNRQTAASALSRAMTIGAAVGLQADGSAEGSGPAAGQLPSRAGSSVIWMFVV